MKKRIAIIYSGQIRTNSLSPTPRDTAVLDSLEKYFINDEFKSKYDYDVFISTDKIDVERAFKFFGCHLINIAFWEEKTYFYPIDRPTILSHQALYHKFISRDFAWYNPYPEQYHQYYRSYLAYEMVKDHQEKTKTEYDYFIKLRPDIRLQKRILPIFEQLENGKKAFMEHNLFEVGSFDLFDLFKHLAHHYGDFHNYFGDGENTHGEYPNFCPMDCSAIRFSSEMQVTNCLYHLMNQKGYPPSEYFFGSIYNGPSGSQHTYCVFHR